MTTDTTYLCFVDALSYVENEAGVQSPSDSWKKRTEFLEEHFNQRETKQSCWKNRIQALVNHVVSEHKVVIVGIRPLEKQDAGSC